MSYIIRQKIRGRLYAYEVTARWDPIKKQPRQKRRYLGVWDEKTGTIKEKVAERDIRTTKSYGAAYLLRAIAETISLQKKLSHAFGEDGHDILALAIAKVIDPTSLRNISHVMEDASVPELSGARHAYSSQWLSRFLEQISKNETGLRTFHSTLIGKDEDTLIYDITSLTSYSENIDWLEYGDDYRKLGLPQVNLGVVLSVKRKIPIYHKVFPGSVPDVVTLKNLVQEVKELGVKDCLFVLDRGFFSESNLMEMFDEHVEFVLPLPFSTKIGKCQVSGTNATLECAVNARRYGRDIYYVLERKLEIAGHSVHAYVFSNEKRKGDEVTSFYNRLMDIETTLEGKRARGNAFKHFARVAGAFRGFFKPSVKDRVLHLRRRPKAIAQAMNRMGKMILLSSIELEWDEALSIYRERDALEKMYDELKNDLDITPLRVRKNETFKGLLIVYLVAMILRSLLLQRARKARLLEKESVEGLLREMGKLRVVHVGNTWKLTEVTKKQRTMLEKIEVAVPVVPET